MCGICGKVTWSGDGNELAPLAAMTAALAHRGPDDSGVWTSVAGPVAVGLGNRRLSIIDLSPNGRQPMANEDASVWIAYNGEIYNYRELAETLAGLGHRFRSASDTETILHAYEEYGAECLRRLRGMFAFALWDGRRGELFCARDPVGIKPFYYYHDGRRFVFGSEIKAILADPAVPRAVDPAGLRMFLVYGHGVGPGTIFRGIHKLLPGHWLRLKADGTVRVERYWDVPLGPPAVRDPATAAVKVEAALRAAVRSHMVSDVPVGAFLSGGLDSSAIVALMSEVASEPVRTFSVGFDAGAEYDETAHARRVAEHFGTVHREVRVGAEDFWATLADLAWHFDEPFADAAAVPVALLAREARRSVKVVLTGEGSDELFAGYRRTSVERFGATYARLPRGFRTGLSRAVDRLPRLRRIKKATRTLVQDDSAVRYGSWLTVLEPDRLPEVLETDWWDAGVEADPFQPYRHHRRPGLDVVTQALYWDFKTWLPDTYLEKVDKATMAESLEARVPFLDVPLVELAFSLPPEHKIRGLDTKHVLKRAVRDLLPEDIVRRPKHGFSVPTDPWFRGPLRAQLWDTLCSSRFRSRGFFRAPAVEELLRQHASGRHVLDGPLFALLAFELWCQAYLDRVHP